MKKIAIITTFHGKFRNDIGFWLKSIEYNSTIDFFLFTDLPVSVSYSNLKVINKSFEELVAIAQKNFDFDLCIPRPQKYPDLRPAFGEIFKEYLKDYDFWGFSEQDLVYGDIRHFITDDLLDKYDKIMGRGHFTLYRNTEEINSSYKLVDYPTYKSVLTDGRNFFFEEYWGTSRYWDKNRHDKFFQGILFDDINMNKYHFRSVKKEKEDIGKKNFIYSFEKGKVYRIYEQDGEVKKDQTLYVHFQKRKMDVQTEPSDYFTIVPNAFIPFIENVDIEILNKYGHTRYFYKQKYVILWNRIKMKWYKITHPIDMRKQ